MGPRTTVASGVRVWLVLVVWALAAALSAEPPGWQVASGDVHVLCPMTVGGSFEARTSKLSGTLALASGHPVALNGSLSVDLGSLDTGIGLRNEHLREKYLEVGKGEGFDKVTLSEIRLPDADGEGVQGTTPFTGSFRLHGTTRPVKGQAQIRREGSGVRVEASFPVLLPEYGIEKPRYLGVGVKDEVQVKVSFVAAPVAPAGVKP